VSATVYEIEPPTRPTTLKAHVYAILREAITTGKFRPGARLDESQLARDLNISRIPIREALMQLQEHGLVMNHERRGMFVTELSGQEVQQINSLRVVLEAEALKLCQANLTKQIRTKLTGLVERMEGLEHPTNIDASALDLEFHRTIWQAGRNPYLSKTLDSLTVVLFAHTTLDNVSKEDLHWRLNHHREFLQVALGESDLAPEEAVIRHLRMHYDNPERYSSLGVKA
jgi:DNA-binding GntR family transcriptional regulator